MASVTPGPLVGSISGRVGGVLFRGAGSGALASAAPAAARSVSQSQSNHRALLEQVTREWLALEETERLSWETAAEQAVARTQERGARPPSGRGEFTSWRLNTLYTRATPLYMWPYYQPSMPAITASAAVSAAAPLSCVITFDWYLDGATAAVWVTRTTNARRFSGRPAYTQIYGQVGDPVLPWTIGGAPPNYTSSLDLSSLFEARFLRVMPGTCLQFRVLVSSVFVQAYPPTLILTTAA